LRAAFALIQGVREPDDVGADAWRWCSTDPTSRFAPDVAVALDALRAPMQVKRRLCAQIQKHYVRTEPTALKPFVEIANAAALTSPWERQAWSLFGVYCEGCAERGPNEWQGWGGFRDVDTFDEAVRCGRCDGAMRNPFDWKAPAPHPVTRCLGGVWGHKSRCLAHDGLKLRGHPPLCTEGRRLLEHALTEVGIRRARGAEAPPLDREIHKRLMSALAHHHLLTLDDKWADLMTNDRRGLFAALAAHDPEMKQAFEEALGRPIDTSAANPTFLAALTLDKSKGIVGWLRGFFGRLWGSKALRPGERT
jgi:hypothetical protein